MYAILRELHYDEGKLARADAALEEFRRIHASQPGFRGSLSVDLGGGARFVINLWETRQHSDRGREALGPAVRRLVEPLLAFPARLIGAGPVTEDDLTGAHASP